MTLAETIAAVCAGFLLRDAVRVLCLSVYSEIQGWEGRDSSVPIVRRIAYKASYLW